MTSGLSDFARSSLNEVLRELARREVPGPVDSFVLRAVDALQCGPQDITFVNPADRTRETCIKHRRLC